MDTKASKHKAWCYILGGAGLLGMFYIGFQYELVPSLVSSGYQGFVDLGSNSSWRSAVYQRNFSWSSAVSNLHSFFRSPELRADDSQPNNSVICPESGQGACRLPPAAAVATVTKGPRPGDADYVCEKDTRKVITLEHNVWHRLGNSIYELAAMIHIADVNNRKPVLPQTMGIYIDRAFGIRNRFCGLPNKEVDALYSNVSIRQRELEQNNLILPDRFKGSDVYVIGYLQKRDIYVKPVADRMREICRFKPPVVKQAKFFIYGITKSDYINIGIHLRAGAYERFSERWGQEGQILPDNDYFKRSFAYFDKMYPKVQYIVCSFDRDPAWIAANLKHPNIIVNHRRFSAAVDMAILALCDHVITSVGTFSWWAGWFNGGTMIYPSNGTERNNRGMPRGALGLPSKAHGFSGET